MPDDKPGKIYVRAQLFKVEGDPEEEDYKLVGIGEFDPEPWDRELGKLYSRLVQEYGKVKSKVHIDTKSRGTLHTGWVFHKRVGYEDKPKKTYLQEAWVSLYEGCPLDDPLAVYTDHKDGSRTTHPFKTMDIDDYRRRSS